jgi:Uma2 family endonuclease
MKKDEFFMATVTTLSRIGPADHGRAMNFEEFQEAEVEEGYRYELARGVLEVTKVPNDPHGEIVWTILRFLGRYDLEHPRVIRRAGGGSEYRFWLPGMTSGRNPDVAVTLRHTPRDWRGHRPACLAFEVVSEGSEAHERDHVSKRAEYLAYGLREYWVVDPRIKAVTVLVRDGDVWVERNYREEQQALSLVLPGFTVRVADLWADEDDDAGSDSTFEIPNSR